MNLFWLKFVSYAFLAGAAYFYFVLRLNRLAHSRLVKVILYAACIAMACVCWHVQESNAEQHSPRRLVVGTVAWVSASHHKGGSIDYDFQLQPGGGSLSPKFSTDTVADDAAGQPIHPGDLLGVLYRTWDGVPVTIDELQGQHAGWHYRRYDDGSAYIFAVTVVGLVGLTGGLVASRRQGPAKPTAETVLNLND